MFSVKDCVCGVMFGVDFCVNYYIYMLRFFVGCVFVFGICVGLEWLF